MTLSYADYLAEKIAAAPKDGIEPGELPEMDREAPLLDALTEEAEVSA